MENLKDLLVENLKDLYNAENQQVKSLQKMARAATRPDLKRALEQHLEQTRGQVEKLEKLCTNLGVSPRGKKCVGMEGLIEEGAEILAEKSDGEPSVIDAGIIVAVQKAEHYEIAGYGAARTFAQQLGLTQAARVLQRILDEEKKADEKLNVIAEKGANIEAAQGEMKASQRKSAAVRKSTRTTASRSTRRASTTSRAKSVARSRASAGSRSTASRSTARLRSAASRSGAAAGRSRSNGNGRRASSGRSSQGSTSSRMTTNHDMIRQWVEDRGGHPACVKHTGRKGDMGLLRIDYPGYSGQDTLQEISWDEFFEKFDQEKLAFLFQDKTANGRKSRFSKLVDRRSNK